MSSTIALDQHLLTKGQRYQQLGLDGSALRIFRRLAKLRDLPAQLAEEVHVRIAQILLRMGRFTRARRHLAIALSHEPACARYYYLMATALVQDEDADPARAAHYYRRALRLDPEQPERWAEYGLLALSLGERGRGLKALRRAARLAPDDPGIIGKVVEGLCEEARPAEARQLLLAARFRNARDPRFQRLWSRFQFERLHVRQQKKQRVTPMAQGSDERRVLPFILPGAKTHSEEAGRQYRMDAASPLAGPRLVAQHLRPGRKHG